MVAREETVSFRFAIVSEVVEYLTSLTDVTMYAVGLDASLAVVTVSIFTAVF